MDSYDAAVERAEDNLRALQANSYPGRGIVLGRDTFGNCIVVYWIMGRSAGSRSRYFEKDGECVRVEALDPSQVTNPELTLYKALDRLDGRFVVSNGRQTDTIIEAFLDGADFASGLAKWKYEPDPPNYTPRISGVLTPKSSHCVAQFAILKRAPDGSCQPSFYRYKDLPHGLGYCVHTYKGDGNPLPSFEGEPYLLPLVGSFKEIRRRYWDALNRENRVSLALKVINPDDLTSFVEIVNQYEKIPA